MKCYMRKRIIFSKKCNLFGEASNLHQKIWFLAPKASWVRMDGHLTCPIGRVFKNAYILFEFCVGAWGALRDNDTSAQIRDAQTPEWKTAGLAKTIVWLYLYAVGLSTNCRFGLRHNSGWRFLILNPIPDPESPLKIQGPILVDFLYKIKASFIVMVFVLTGFVYLFQSENPFTDRISYHTSVKLVYSYTFLNISNNSWSKICFELAFSCTSASDNGGRKPSHRDRSGGGHGRF